MKITEEKLNFLLESLTDNHRLREGFIKNRTTINNQKKAMIRTSKNLPDDIKPDIHFDIMQEQIKKIKKVENIYEKNMKKIGEQLPHHDWFTSHDGCGLTGFCLILAETGNLSNYKNPAKVWKRMGLSVLNGQAEKNFKKGENTGYNKRRRMIAYRISDSIIKKQGHYREVYVARKQYEIERDENEYNNIYVESKKTHMLNSYKSKNNQERIKNGQLPLFVIDLRAQRYMIKKLIKDFWIKWTEELGINLEWKSV